MKKLFLGILLIIVVGFGGLVYRNAIEHPSQPIACPLDAEVCPDGTSVARTGLSCTFPTCPPPNVSLAAANIAFAVPAGFTETSSSEASTIATYQSASASSTNPTRITIHQFAVDASSTPLSVIQQTAISGTSGESVSAASFSSSVLGDHRFTVVAIERFEGVIDTAYYLVHGSTVLRFDAIDANVPNWTDASLNLDLLPAHAALIKMLTTLVVL